MQEPVNILEAALTRRYGTRATWVETTPAWEPVGGGIWNGEVETFDLENHPEANQCFGWIEPPVALGREPRLFTELRVGAVQTADDAVRASVTRRTRERIERLG